MLSPSDVTAVVVTRGDVDLTPVLDSIIFETVVWDNLQHHIDLGSFGRYVAAVALTRTPVIYFQDDDCIVPPEAQEALLGVYEPGLLVANMEAGWGAGHPYWILPGWGSLSDRDLPTQAFCKWCDAGHSDESAVEGCDVIFPVLTPGKRYDFGRRDLAYAHEPKAKHLQPGFMERRQWYYDTALRLRLESPH